MNFVLFALAVIGLTNIILESTLFDPVRKLAKKVLNPFFYEVFECHQCMGTWVGMVLGVIVLGSFWHFLLYGFVGSALTSTYHRLFVFAEEYILAQSVGTLDIGENE